MLTRTNPNHNKNIYFVLPFVGLGVFELGGSDNVIQGFVSELNGSWFSEIHIRESRDCLYIYNENFVLDCELEDCTILIFKIPENYEEDILKFSSGNYSGFSQSARNAIISNSGLIWKQLYPGDKKEFKGETVSHIWLQAISNDSSDRLQARRTLERQIGQSLDGVKEYISKPDESEFKKFNPANRIL